MKSLRCCHLFPTSSRWTTPGPPWCLAASPSCAIERPAPLRVQDQQAYHSPRAAYCIPPSAHTIVPTITKCPTAWVRNEFKAQIAKLGCAWLSANAQGRQRLILAFGHLGARFDLHYSAGTCWPTFLRLLRLICRFLCSRFNLTSYHRTACFSYPIALRSCCESSFHNRQHPPGRSAPRSGSADTVWNEAARVAKAGTRTRTRSHGGP